MDTVLIRLRKLDGKTETAIVPATDWEITKSIAEETEGAEIYTTRGTEGTYENVYLPETGVYSHYTPYTYS